jgi:diguanylate cyclase (GGDEF)-like protein
MTTRAADDQAAPARAGEEVAALQRELAELRAELARTSARLAEAERLADGDTLTPLLNRRAFLRELARTQAHAARYGGPASLVYLDLDRLKLLNDRFGHAAGDAALKAVADQLLAHVRTSDTVGRIGGDEFGVILVEANGFQAEAKAAALAEAIAGGAVEGLDPAARLGVSWGVAEIRSDIAPEAVIAEADAAMYAAKRARRP